MLFRDVVSDKIIETKYSNSASNLQIDDRAEALRCIGAEVKTTRDILCELPPTFPGTLLHHMKRLDITVDVLAEKSLVSTKTIQRMRSNAKNDAKLPTVVAVCIGLQLNPILSADMVRKSGNVFIIDEEHIIYQILLNSHYQNSIYECNEILRANNCKPLGREE